LPLTQVIPYNLTRAYYIVRLCALFAPGAFFFFPAETLFAQSNVDSLQSVVKRRLKDNIRDIKTAEMCITLARFYFHDNSQDFFYFASEAIQISSELRDPGTLGTAYSLLGNKYMRMGALSLALKAFHTGLDANIRLQSNEAIIYTLCDIGNIYYGKKMYDMAARYYRRGLDLKNAPGKIEHPLSVCYINLGLVSLQRAQYDSAMINFRKAHELRLELGNRFYIAHSTYYFGRTYQEMGRHDSALYYFKSALNALDRNLIRDEYNIEIFEFRTDCIYAMLDVYSEMGDKANAYALLKSLLDDRYTIGTASAQRVYLRYSDFLSSEHDYASSLKYLNLALQLSDSLGLTDDRLIGLVKKATLLEKLNRHTDALKVYKEYTLLNDSLTAFTVSSDLINLADKQELEAQDDKMREIISGKEEEILTTTLTRDLLVIIFLLAGAVLYTFYRKYRLDNSILTFLRTLINSLPYPFYVVNAQSGSIDYYNDSTEASADKLKNLRKTDTSLLYTADLAPIIAELTAGKTVLRKYFEVKHTDNSTSYFESSNFPVYDVSGELTGIIEYIRDITQIKETEVRLQQYATELEESNLSKDRLISVIAHDLKNPFGVLLGSLNILKDNYKDLTDEERYRFISNLRDAAVRVYMLVENLLDWSILSAGRVMYSPEKISLTPLLKETAEPFLLELKIRGISLGNDIDEEIAVFGDQYILRTVVRNLLSNAIKFTPDGGSILLKAQVHEEFASISVIDSGIGISQEDIAKLFRPDVLNSDIGTPHSKKGTGLGLLICGDFVKLNKGEISVTSEPGLGTDFTFTIPLYEAKAEEQISV